MPFVKWHYRNGYYVRSHFRRLPWRRADASTMPLFAWAGSAPPLSTGVRHGQRAPRVAQAYQLVLAPLG